MCLKLPMCDYSGYKNLYLYSNLKLLYICVFSSFMDLELPNIIPLQEGRPYSDTTFSC